MEARPPSGACASASGFAAVFAMALNVSIKTVQAWESGARVPDGGNLKLLRVGEAHPEVGLRPALHASRARAAAARPKAAPGRAKAKAQPRSRR